MQKAINRFIAVVMAVLMCMTLLPIRSWAYDVDPSDCEHTFEATVLEVREAEGCWLAGIRITSNGATTALVVTDGEELMKKMQSSGEFSISIKAMLLGWVRQDVPYFITNKVRIK